MASTWLQIRVELEGGRDIEREPSPGRVFIVGPKHSFAQLAEAIDLAFARWDATCTCSSCPMGAEWALRRWTKTTRKGGSITTR